MGKGPQAGHTCAGCVRVLQELVTVSLTRYMCLEREEWGERERERERVRQRKREREEERGREREKEREGESRKRGRERKVRETETHQYWGAGGRI